MGQRSPEALERRKAGSLLVQVTPERKAKLARVVAALDTTQVALVSHWIDTLPEPGEQQTAVLEDIDRGADERRGRRGP